MTCIEYHIYIAQRHCPHVTDMDFAEETEKTTSKCFNEFMTYIGDLLL